MCSPDKTHLSFTLKSHEYSFIHGINDLQMTLFTFGSLVHKIEPQHLEDTVPTLNQSTHNTCNMLWASKVRRDWIWKKPCCLGQETWDRDKFDSKDRLAKALQWQSTVQTILSTRATAQWAFGRRTGQRMGSWEQTNLHKSITHRVYLKWRKKWWGKSRGLPPAGLWGKDSVLKENRTNTQTDVWKDRGQT